MSHLNRNLVNLVEHVDGRDINTVALNNINKVVLCCIVAEHNIGVVYAILTCQDGCMRCVRKAWEGKQKEVRTWTFLNHCIWHVEVEMKERGEDRNRIVEGNIEAKEVKQINKAKIKD